MATYKAVMRPALEYASSIWSPLSPSTRINKLQVMQNSALISATGITQTYNIGTHTSHTRAHTAPRVTIQTENTTSITPLTPTYNNLRHSKAKKHYLQQRSLHNKHCHRPLHSHYNRHKTNIRHVNTFIVSRHLATRGKNKILRTPPPHIISSEEILLRRTHRTLA